ncbi:MAG: superoxide dismutase family protein [Syntrophomonadaceae bacterium]|nr:superoxide dismutase family protein [Syntrophomonadaceae bacterium]
MIDQTVQLMFQTMLRTPEACAHIIGSSAIHNLIGDVYVYPFLEGSLVVADVEGIPFSGFYGFHIHQRGPCIRGEGYTGFYDVGGHFASVADQPHPFHSGDLPVLMAYYGHAFMIVYTDRFKPEEILGRAIIIHELPDDYKTQPAGNSGNHIGCGDFYPCCEQNWTQQR